MYEEKKKCFTTVCFRSDKFFVCCDVTSSFYFNSFFLSPCFSSSICFFIGIRRKQIFIARFVHAIAIDAIAYYFPMFANRGIGLIIEKYVCGMFRGCKLVWELERIEKQQPTMYIEENIPLKRSPENLWRLQSVFFLHRENWKLFFLSK